MAFYLKYRPQTVDELDLEAVRGQISKILSSSHLPHAFLFSGPKGLGKTSAARILAKAINCKQKPDTSGQKPVARNQKPDAGSQKSDTGSWKLKTGSWKEPCNKCEICKSITNGTALDLIEIDGASNRGIDDIRSLRETIKLTPSRLKYKIYVIDESHMLTKEAFNALLKTLEEPSAHAIFVLATTEPEKIPETIISRCIQIKFKKASTKEMIRSLGRVAKGEKLKVDDGALKLIVQNADGSFRDAVKLLEQLSFDNKNITFEQAENLINQSGQFDLLKWLFLILTKDIKESLLMLEEAIEEGVDLRWLVVKSLEKLRDYLFYRQGVIVNLGDKEEKWSRQVDKINIEAKDLIGLMKLLDKAGVGLKNAQVPGLPLQLAIMEWGGNIEYEIPDIKNTLRSRSTPKDGQAGLAYEKLKIKEIKGDKKEKIMEEIKQEQETKKEKVISPKKKKELKTNLKNVLDNWEKFLQALRPHNSSVEALLRSTRPLKMEDGFLTVEAFYQFHKDRLGDEKCLKVMETVLEKLFGEPVKVKCVLGKRSQKPDTRSQKPDTSEETNIIKNAEEIFMV